MNYHQASFSRSESLNNLSENKINYQFDLLKDKSSDIQNIFKTAWARYAEANIPVEYWTKSMEKDFVGDKSLKELYNNYVNDLKSSYINGSSYCLAGNYGLGKSLCLTSILKKACDKGFICLYTNLSDVVHVLTKAPANEMYLARKELIKSDFLVIDEFDPRFMASENSADLYARTLETIFRTRASNKLPTLMSTNSPNVINSFTGDLKESLDSLFNGYIEIVPVLGKDFRKI